MDINLSWYGHHLELHGALVADRRVTPPGIVEALDVVEDVCAGLVAGAVVLRSVRSIFSDEKKLSIAELSHTLPDRLIEQTMP